MLLVRSGCAVRSIGLLHSAKTIAPSSASLLHRAHYGQLPVVGSPAAVPPPEQQQTPTPSPHHADSHLSIYEGPFSQTAKRLKLFSVSSLGATIALCPFIFLLDAGISNGMRGGLAVAAVATSGSSTALVQWCLGSYVRKITLPNPAGSATQDPTSMTVTRSTPVSFETLSFWGGKRITTVKVSDLEPSSAPFSTIRIRAGQASTVRDGRGRILSEGNQLKKRFYLHSELAEDEPLRTIMAEIQQNQHLTTGAGVGPRSAVNRTAAGSTSAHDAASSKQDAGAAEKTVKAPVTEGMSDRIEQLKKKASKSKQQQQQQS
ncbi:hypothetical protein EC957_003038 [Mortierella hygrophila]|uniref:Uncharacterized protein n=1 Tax=Mortierella hygrophila TaxID=979708 RepID=A0A9P6F3R9_9FUNG|nr:hypothetical protein EC957_003038 [Mortierella hygrophila]